MSGTVKLTEEDVKAYLDRCIRYWRQRVEEKHHDTFESKQGFMAKCYVDAYQRVRITLFGKRLSKEE